MATIQEIIERVDDTKPNAFSQKTKMAWIAELDGKIAADVMLMDISEIRQLKYAHPQELDSEPLVGFPHDSIYDLWLGAKIDFANGEYNKYQNSMEQFNAHYGNFVRWFAASYAPAQGYAKACDCAGGENPPYYITAYALAVMRGYKGSLDQWLESLRGEQGEKGDQVELRCVNEVIQWRWITDGEPKDREWKDLLDMGPITLEAREAQEQAREMAGQAAQAAGQAQEYASSAAVCSTRLELVRYDNHRIGLRVYLEGQAVRHMTQAGLAVYRRTANRVSFRYNHWNCRTTGYAEVAKVPFGGAPKHVIPSTGKRQCPYPEVPSWMPNRGAFQNYFPLTQEILDAGYFEIPDVSRWLLPMVVPGYDFTNDCFDWDRGRIIGSRYKGNSITDRKELKSPAQFAFAIVTPVPEKKLWEYPICGRWTNTVSVFGDAGKKLLGKANEASEARRFMSLTIIVR